MDSSKNNKKKMAIFLSVILIFLIGFILGAAYGMIYESQQTSEKLDEYFGILYEKEIYPVGESEIQNFVINLNNLTAENKINESEKYNMIADFVTKNFRDYYWEKYSLNNSDYTFKSISSFLGNYAYDEYGNVRTYYSSPYRNDPVWIAYYKAGACGELASLFGNITNRTGTPVIQIVATFKGGGNHAWVEIMMENGERKYFDPTVYGEHSLFGKWPEGYWFGNMSDYRVFSAEMIEGVYEAETRDEVTWRYDLLQNKPEVKIKRIDVAICDINKNFKNITHLFIY